MTIVWSSALKLNDQEMCTRFSYTMSFFKYVINNVFNDYLSSGGFNDAG